MNTPTKIVLKYSLITFSALLALMLLSFTILSLFLPRFLADSAYNLGLNQISQFYYLQTYKQTNQTDDLYNLLNVAIINSDYEQVVTSFTELALKSDYNTLINQINNETNESNLEPMLKSALLNEHNYLSNQYVLSLVKTDKLNVALNYAKQTFTYNSFTLENLGNYNFKHLNSEFYQSAMLTEFGNEYVNGNTLIESVIGYFHNLITLYNSEVSVSQPSNLTLSQLIYFRNRIVEVGNTIIAYNTAAINDILTTVEVQNELQLANQKLALLLQ